MNPAPPETDGTRSSNRQTSPRRPLRPTQIIELLTPSGLVNAARAAHPTFRYAIAGAGLAALVTVVIQFGTSPVTLVFGSLILVVLMVLILVFHRAVLIARRSLGVPARVLLWTFLVLPVLSILLLFSSAFFDRPLRLRNMVERWFGSSPPSPAVRPPLPAAKRVRSGPPYPALGETPATVPERRDRARPALGTQAVATASAGAAAVSSLRPAEFVWQTGPLDLGGATVTKVTLRGTGRRPPPGSITLERKGSRGDVSVAGRSASGQDGGWFLAANGLNCPAVGCASGNYLVRIRAPAGVDRQAFELTALELLLDGQTTRPVTLRPDR